MDEESIDLLLIHYVKTRILWELSLLFLGCLGVLSSSVRETIGLVWFIYGQNA